MHGNSNIKFTFGISIRIFFLEDMGAVSDGHGERFHRDTSLTAKRYSGKWSSNILAHYSWSHVRQTTTGVNKRKKKRSECLMNFIVVRVLYIEI